MEHPQHIENKQLSQTQPQIWLRTVLQKNGRQISDNQMNTLGKYVRLLLEWNAKMNLISRRDVGNVWQSHILHSLSPFLKIDLFDNARVLDLGAGGGLPGIPWKILLPSISVTMIDATQKKINAVDSIIRELQLSNINAIWGRAEDLGRSVKLRGAFDYVVARGVGTLDELAGLALPFLTRNRAEPTISDSKQIPRSPALLAFKGGDVENEVRRAKLIREVTSIEIVPLNVDGSEQTELAEKKLALVSFDNMKEST